ncbi:MAG: hypothetical protein WCD47_04570 [Candidatus Sulfotelmatobacter sp.]
MRIAFNPRLMFMWWVFMWRGRPRPRNAESKIALEGNCVVCILLLSALAITPYASAQRGASGGHAAAPSHSAAPHFNSPHFNSPRFNPPRFNPPHNAPAFGRSGYRSGFGRNSSYPYGSTYASLPFPFFGDSFDPDDIYSTGYPVASQPPPYLLQALSQMTGPAVNNIGQAMSSPTVNESSSSQPLMIELQNGHYVRVTSTIANGDPLPLDQSPIRPRSSQALSPIHSTPPAQPLPPAVLIFRDGHREEVRDYSIADGILYARGDYYTDGYWNKKIDLASLNVAETLRANNERNVNFVLPSSPNEVVTRP